MAARNESEVAREARLARHRAWLRQNADHVREYKRKYNAANRDRNSSSCRKWGAKNKEKRREYYAAQKDYRNGQRRAYKKRKRQTDINWKLLEYLRSRVSIAIRSARSTKHATTCELLGCSLDSFKLYLESKFESGMSWDNYGYRGWHVDHIMPCAIFDLSKPEHQKRCFHFSNLQPLWATDNQRKRSKVLDGQFNLI